MSKQEWKMGQILVAFSKYMNFTATTYNSRMDLGRRRCGESLPFASCLGANNYFVGAAAPAVVM